MFLEEVRSDHGIVSSTITSIGTGWCELRSVVMGTCWWKIIDRAQPFYFIGLNGKPRYASRRKYRICHGVLRTEYLIFLRLSVYSPYDPIDAKEFCDMPSNAKGNMYRNEVLSAVA